MMFSMQTVFMTKKDNNPIAQAPAHLPNYPLGLDRDSLDELERGNSVFVTPRAGRGDGSAVQRRLGNRGR
jgi:hypothetical protein